MGRAESAQLCFAQIARTVVLVIHDEHGSAIGELPTQPQRSRIGPPTKCRRMHPISDPIHAVTGSVVVAYKYDCGVYSIPCTYTGVYRGNCPAADLD